MVPDADLGTVASLGVRQVVDSLAAMVDVRSLVVEEAVEYWAVEEVVP